MSVSEQIEVVYAEPHRQRSALLSWTVGMTVAQALDLACQRWRLDMALETAVGIFGQEVSRSQMLSAGDRVEIYRPLVMDAKEARLARAAEQRHSG